MLKEKLDKIQQTLRDKNMNGLLLGNFGFNVYDDLLYYLLLRIPEYALILIPNNGKATLYAIPFEVPELKIKYPHLSVLPLSLPIDLLIRKHFRDGSKICVRPKTLPSSVYTKLAKIRRIKFTSYDTDAYLMSIKLPKEISYIKKACQITDKIFTNLVKNWRKFKTETDAARFVHVEAARLGVEPAFPTIIASGKNGSNPHYHPKNNRLQKGFCVIDMGVRFSGYCSDMTRTIYIGTPSQKDVRLYDKVLTAQTDTIKKVQTGSTTALLDLFCREQLGKRLDKQFIHGLGHGLGAQVHEWPSVSRGQDVVLEENMVITIEPGVYKKHHYGIRIEDDIVVTKKGAAILNRSTKELIRR